MLGAIAGDIIASPYLKSNAQGKDFEMFAHVRAWSSGKEVSFFPKPTDSTVMTIAVARWLAADSDYSRENLINFHIYISLSN